MKLTRRLLGDADFLGGVLIIALAAFFFISSQWLNMGTARNFGPAFVPRLISGGLGILGIGMLIMSLSRPGERVGVITLREPLLVIGSVIAFGLTVETFGLFLSTILVVVIGGAARTHFRLLEVFVVGVVLATACSLVFVSGLGLQMSIFPRM